MTSLYDFLSEEIKEKIINRIKLEWNKDVSFQPGDPESILFGH